MNTDTLINRIADIPNRISRTTDGWSDEQLHEPPAPGEWSTADVLAHLRSADDILTPRIYMMLVRDNPTLMAYEERKWAIVMGYAEANFHTSLQTYISKRAELVNVLRRLTPQDWQRTGIHEHNGSLTIEELVNELLLHEAEHCRQIESMRPQAVAPHVSYVRALVIDNQPESRQKYKAMLEGSGYSVVVAEDNATALDILLADPNFQIVLADFDVLGQHDLNFLDSLRVIYPRLPVVVLGADEDLEWEAMARERGAEAFFYEPVNMQDVLESVLALTGQKTY
ncbi:MAG: response regulator [Anaerolineaceae bacterium]|nr:response regulator [Anaerolineaceae bacterium]